MWDFDTLWAKARLYAARATDEDREGSLFPFWSILALELLARATLASVHPVLLADGREGPNIMYAFGYGTARAPKSVPAKTVFVRCAQVVESFTEEDIKRATALIEMRNEELHSGGTPLEGLSTRSWLVDYYRLCQLLLGHLNKTLAELFDEEEAVAAQRMIDAADEKIIGEVRRVIAQHRSDWQTLPSQEKEIQVDLAATLRESTREKTWFWPAKAGTAEDCPACDTQGWLTGEVVHTSEPRVGEDLILQTFTKLPTAFQCFACGLSISGEAQVHAAGLSSLFTVEIGEDPASFYGLDTSPGYSDYEPDFYGND